MVNTDEVTNWVHDNVRMFLHLENYSVLGSAANFSLLFISSQEISCIKNHIPVLFVRENFAAQINRDKLKYDEFHMSEYWRNRRNSSGFICVTAAQQESCAAVLDS